MLRIIETICILEIKNIHFFTNYVKCIYSSVAGTISYRIFYFIRIKI